VSKSSMSIAPGVIVENIGDDVVVMVPGSTEVIRLSGDGAQLVRALRDGHPVVPTQTVTELVNRGILVSPTGMSRRGLIKAGAIGAGAGITVMAMPNAAVASSIQFIDLIGGWYENLGFYNFELANAFWTPPIDFPDPMPSTDISDVSKLSIAGTTVDIESSNLDVNNGALFISWGGAITGFTDGDEGTFTWVGTDGITRYYRVTFSAT